MIKIFVYGTLLSGLCRAAALKDAVFLGTASAEGWLYNLGDYPGMLPGGDAAGGGLNRVYGEVYEVDARTLDRLDGIEDYYPNCTESSLYLRQPIPVSFSDGSTALVETYLYNCPIPESLRIPHGDYRRFLKENVTARP